MASNTQRRKMEKAAPITRKHKALIEKVVAALREHNGCIPLVASMFTHAGKQLTKSQVMNIAKKAGIPMMGREAPTETATPKASPERKRAYALSKVLKSVASHIELDIVLPASQQCKWPTVEHGKGDFSWCPNLRMSDTLPYCEEHEQCARVKMKYGKENWAEAQRRKDTENELSGELSD